MKCPTCPEARLVITDRQGVEIDFCPECRGVWLDRGELDKIIERSVEGTVRPSQKIAGARSRRQERYDDDDDDRYERGPRRRRKSSAAEFLSEIFDFD